MEKKSLSAGNHNSEAGSDAGSTVLEDRKENEELKKQLRQLKKEHEIELVNVKTALKEELRRMQTLVERDFDKRNQFDLENNFKLLEEKNRMLITEVVSLRRANNMKDA